MRYPPEHKAKTRQRILDVTSQALREHGPDGISVASIMKRVGLTHGGFYAHFKNRDELISEAVLQAAEATANKTFAPEHALDEVLKRYLSIDHMANRSQGCVVAAIGSSAAYQSEPVQQALHKAGRGLIDLVDGKCSQKKSADEGPSKEAITTTAQMLGGVILARLMDGEDPELAARILNIIREA